jgi:hypothetical protein
LSKKFPFTITKHAAEVIAQRGISLEWVERVLKKPQKVEPDAEDPALRHALARIPEHGDRVLRVIYNEFAEPWSVVTAYFDRSLRGKI